MAFGDDPLDGLTLADYVGDDWQDGYVRLDADLDLPA
jgi:hypothetical protein